MVSQKVRVKNPSGLHLRPAGVLSVLGACVKEGDEITFECEGEDEDQALATMVKAVEEGLGEEQKN